jgi:four helix bundle protein
MNIAQGSLEECRYYLILSNDLEYANTMKLMLQLDEVSKLLFRYSTTVANSVS